MSSFNKRRKARGSSYTYPKNKELGTNSEHSETKKNANNKLNQTGGDSKYKPREAVHHPKVMVYPVARGPRSITGDTLLNSKGVEMKEINPKSFKMVNLGASDRINSLTGGQKEKHIYYVELPIPQDVNDNNSVTWGDDSMNILQLAGLAVAQKAFTQDIGRTFDEAKNLLTKGIFDGASTMIKDESVKQGIVAALTGTARLINLVQI